ncbi:MAG: transporter substrate-binding domain-containing protein [Nitrospiraceae bacterium]|nr:MAG: transporter substrate-binding domain-containing protein [Nitrospiraceae bacterium]
MFRSFRTALVLGITMFLAVSCATPDVEQTEQGSLPPLRVGVTLNYPPIIFTQGGEPAGVEGDLARLLAEKLGRPLQFVNVAWEQQIPALLAGQTDIIMSGMSITKAREVRVAFTDPYLKSGLVAMMRVEDAQRYSSIEAVRQNIVNIGVVEGTTGDVFVRRNFPNAGRIASLPLAADAPTPLRNRSIDIFVHDAPSIIWLVSENESDLAGLWEPLNEEHLAWGVRRDDPEFLSQVNSTLKQWKNDGTLRQVLLKWLPGKYLERFK